MVPAGAGVTSRTNKDKELKDTLAKAPAGIMDQPLLRSVYGHLLLKQNNADSAKYYFDLALKDSKMKDPAVLQEIASANIDVKQGDATYAVDLLNKALKKDKNNPELYVLLGDAYRKLADGGNAYKAYMQALEKNGKYARAEYKIGKIYTSQNNPELYVPAFSRAVNDDSMYAPALYELYYHYYFMDVNMAKDYLKKYIDASDYDIKNDYLVTDMLYATGKYDAAVKSADQLMEKEGAGAEPRLYKLLAYCYKELGNPEKATGYMNIYLSSQNDSGFLAKDFETMGELYASMSGKEDSAAVYYARASMLEKEDTKKMIYYKKISDLYKKIKDYKNEATWLGMYYAAKPNASNVDLFNWGLADYLAKDYPMADSLFTLYEQKYPTEEFGYYWAARSSAAIDTSMEKGLAIPHYKGLLDLYAKDTTSKISKKHLVEAYGYIAAYKANTEKDYEGAIDNFEKLLQMDPENNDAKRSRWRY